MGGEKEGGWEVLSELHGQVQGHRSLDLEGEGEAAGGEGSEVEVALGAGG